MQEMKNATNDLSSGPSGLTFGGGHPLFVCGLDPEKDSGVWV